MPVTLPPDFQRPVSHGGTATAPPEVSLILLGPTGPIGPMPVALPPDLQRPAPCR